MTAQQEADQLLRDHQLTRLLKELELDIVSVVTAHPTGFEPAIGIDPTDWAQPHPTALVHFDRLLA